MHPAVAAFVQVAKVSRALLIVSGASRWRRTLLTSDIFHFSFLSCFYKYFNSFIYNLNIVYLTFVDFMFLGYPKTGTSAIFYLLDQHPELNASKEKETRFFSWANHMSLLQESPTGLRKKYMNFWDLDHKGLKYEFSPNYYTSFSQKMIKKVGMPLARDHHSTVISLQPRRTKRLPSGAEPKRERISCSKKLHLNEEIPLTPSRTLMTTWTSRLLDWIIHIMLELKALRVMTRIRPRRTLGWISLTPKATHLNSKMIKVSHLEK